MTDETATGVAMGSWRNKSPDDSGSGANLTKEKVKRLAVEENYPYLHNCISWYRSDPNVTWEQAMQLAAVELSRVVNQQQKELVRLMNLMPRPPVIISKGKVDVR